MRSPKFAPYRRLVIVTATLLLQFVGLLAVSSASDRFTAAEWVQGADGLIDAIQRVEKEDRPLVVYFNATWCGYCRQFEKELLGKQKVKDYLKSGFAVIIDPDKGTQEKEIARYYGVRGYPAFFVYGRHAKKLFRVERHKMVRGRPQLLSPDEFVAAMKEAGLK